MNKLDASIRLTDIMVRMDELLWEIIDEIGSDTSEGHELQAILDNITDMMLRYERDIEL